MNTKQTAGQFFLEKMQNSYLTFAPNEKHALHCYVLTRIIDWFSSDLADCETKENVLDYLESLKEDVQYTFGCIYYSKCEAEINKIGLQVVLEAYSECEEEIGLRGELTTETLLTYAIYWELETIIRIANEMEVIYE